MDNLLNNPWVIGIGVTVIGGLILYFFFGIGKDKQKNKTNKSSPFISAGGDITAGHDIFIGSKNKIKNTKAKSTYVYKARKLVVTDNEPKNLILPIPIPEFKKVLSKILLINAEDTKWRVGYRFLKDTEPKRDYVFHVYQDPGSNSFNSRIVEIEPGVRELSPDIQKTQLGIEDTKNFELVVENKNGEVFFYVDGIPLGKYKVPLEEITDLYIRGWCHGDNAPITIVVEHVRVWN